MKRIILALLAFGLVLSVNGCAGYRLGSMLPPDIKTVYVPTFVNKTSEPLLEVETTRAFLQELQRDGSLRVVNEEQADAVITVTLRSFSIDPVSYRTEQRTTAREYRILLSAGVVMTRRGSGSVVVDSPNVRGDYVFPIAGDLTSSKLRGIPLAAQDLAHNIVEKIVEVW